MLYAKTVIVNYATKNTKIKIRVLTKPCLPRDFLTPFYIGLGYNTPLVKDELFDAFAIGNYIEKYCRCKQ